jgi:hypothetical protein
MSFRATRPNGSRRSRAKATGPTLASRSRGAETGSTTSSGFVQQALGEKWTRLLHGLGMRLRVSMYVIRMDLDVRFPRSVDSPRSLWSVGFGIREMLLSHVRRAKAKRQRNRKKKTWYGTSARPIPLLVEPRVAKISILSCTHTHRHGRGRGPPSRAQATTVFRRRTPGAAPHSGVPNGGTTRHLPPV